MSKKIETTNTASATVIELPSNLNVSQTIRYLSAQGLTRGQICKYFESHLGRTIRYQHVRNVLITPVKKS